MDRCKERSVGVDGMAMILFNEHVMRLVVLLVLIMSAHADDLHGQSNRLHLKDVV